MSARLARLLTRLYPRAWRKRYGAEFEALLEAEQGGLRTWANVVWSAFCERLVPTQGLVTDQSSDSQLQSWCTRAPWAVYGLAPLLMLAGVYFLACLYLWSGWKIFLPGSSTPFVRIDDGFAIFYFGVGRSVYFSAPVFIGWTIELLAARQRSKVIWPAFGLTFTALMAGLAQVHASRPAVPGGAGRISMTFAPGSSVQEISGALLHALVILCLAVLPVVVWRLHRAFLRTV